MYFPENEYSKTPFREVPSVLRQPYYKDHLFSVSYIASINQRDNETNSILRYFWGSKCGLIIQV